MRIHHAAFRTTDLSRLERFYCDVLGFRIARRDDARGSVWLDAAGAVLMLERAAPGEPPVPPGSNELLAFAVDDKEAWRPRLAIEAETAHTLYFRDPDGRRLAVSSYPFDR
ncbi:MAG TPA: VOC family protein [Polyangiaceae bacterium]|nr:VOC family protein [Polyangiaceae bacterium]